MKIRIDNQLGRRNLKPDQFTLLLGQRYKLEKKQGEITDLTSGKNCQKSTTAETIAKQHGVSEKTVRNAEKVLDAVDALEKIEPGIKQKMLNGEAPASTRSLIGSISKPTGFFLLLSFFMLHYVKL